jgi:hypothetical protein
MLTLIFVIKFYFFAEFEYASLCRETRFIIYYHKTN